MEICRTLEYLDRTVASLQSYRGAGEKQVGSEAQPINAIGDRQVPAQACLGGDFAPHPRPVRLQIEKVILRYAIICCSLLFFVLLLFKIILKEVTIMTTAVRITDDLVRDAKIFSKIDNRSLTGQIEHWARIGKCAEENSDLTYSLIKDIFIGLAELEQGESSEYKFG